MTITKEVPEGEKQEEDDAAGNDGSMSSSRKGTLQRKTCKAAIAPIVSVSAYMPKPNSMSVEKDTEPPKQKRRKSHSQENEEMSALTTPPTKEHKSRPSSPNKDHKKNPSRLVVTHYLIQLEDSGAKSGNNMSMESLSSNSTSVEARLVGLSKEEYTKQKLAAAGEHEEPQDSPDPADDEGGETESTVLEPLSTMG